MDHCLVCRVTRLMVTEMLV